MKKRFIMLGLNIFLLLTLMVTLTYAWFINGAFSNKVIIRTANISSTIELYKGMDFNHDGYLDLDDDGKEIYEELSAKTSDEQFLVIKLDNVIPTAVYTFRIDVTNNGDANGYLSVSTSKDMTSASLNYLQYFSVKYSTNEAVYMDSESKLLFGGTDADMIAYGSEKIYVFQIILNDYDVLKESFTELTRSEYDSLQKITFGDVPFLEVTLSTNKPGGYRV